MSDEGREELTKGEGFASFERRMMNLFQQMAERTEASELEAERRENRIQRNIEFIIQQQAKSEADMQRLRELYEQNEQRWARTDERWVRTSEEIRALLAIAEIHEQEINELRQTQAESQARTDAKMAETGERVDVLVSTVERLISERRNGGRKEPEGTDE